MSVAIDFAVRASAGGTGYGQVGGPDQGSFVQTGIGDSISLNLQQSDILTYTRSGNDLLIELIDGRIITLADWYDTAPGVTNRLYLSTDGTITEILLSDPGDGMLIAEAVPQGGGEKWSPLDDLIFDDGDPLVAATTGVDEPAGMGPFSPLLLAGGGLGTAAVVGGGLIGGGLIGGGSGGGGTGGGGSGGGGTGGGGSGGGGTGGGGSGGGGTGGGGSGGGGTGGGGSGGGGTGGGGSGGGGGSDPHVRGVDGVGSTSTITTNSTPPTLTVTGTGQPGDTVTITVGTQTATATVGTTGRWTATVTTLPPDGTYTTTATFTGNGTTSTLTGPSVVIDMTPPEIAITDGSGSTGDIVNLVDHSDGVTLKGTTEPGATVSVTIDGKTLPATVLPDGTWTVTFLPADVAGGDRSTTVTIVATDRLNNTRTITDTVVLDTIAPPLAVGSVAGNNIVNQAENQSPVVIAGTGAPNSTLNLQISGLPGSITVNVGGDGTWSHPIAAGTLTDGSYTVTATARDAAGNVTERQASFRVDTQMTVAIDPNFADDNVVSLRESQGALTLTGTVPTDATRVEVSWLGQSYPVTLNPNGTWSATFPAGTATMSGMSEIRVTAWDGAENSHTATRPVRIDLETAMTMTAAPAGADGTLSAQERGAGVTVGGDGEAGARIFLTLNGAPHGPATVGADGKWTFTFTSTDLSGLPQGQQARITAYAEDAFGNRSAVETRTFMVDTQVGDFTFDAPNLMGATNDGARDASVLNAAERSAGLPIQGTVEPGATVTIRVAETNSTFTIPSDQTRNGTWSFTLPATALPQGAAQTATITAVATDALGNTAEQRQIIAVDTVVQNFGAGDSRLSTGGDGVLNAREHALGLPVYGTGEVGSTVTVTVNGHTRSAIVGDRGEWSVTFTPDQLPTGERTNIPVSVTATDTAGNVSGPYLHSFAVDTIAPATPTVVATEDVAGSYRAITTTASPDVYSFHQIDSTGAPRQVMAQESTNFRREDRFDFATDIPDGSYLVINTRDAAGNDANTLFIKNTATGVDVNLGREGLQAFDFSAIDLTRAPDARLTINARQLEALTGPDQTLIVKGEATDHVTLQNVTRTQENVTVNGQVYDIYTLGDSGARILLEDDVNRTVI